MFGIAGIAPPIGAKLPSFQFLSTASPSGLRINMNPTTPRIATITAAPMPMKTVEDEDAPSEEEELLSQRNGSSGYASAPSATFQSPEGFE